MNDTAELLRAGLRAGTDISSVLEYADTATIDAVAAEFGLRRGLSPDACDYCRRGVSVGYDHPECMALVPRTENYDGRY